MPGLPTHDKGTARVRFVQGGHRSTSCGASAWMARILVGPTTQEVLVSTELAADFVRAALSAEHPRLAAHIEVAPLDRKHAEHVFIAHRPRGKTYVWLGVGTQVFSAPKAFPMLLRDIVTACEEHLYEVTKATATRLTAKERAWYLWVLEQRMLPCSD